jgi:gas vesicle protein
MMEKKIQKHECESNNGKYIIFGLVIGALAGATAMLLFAPQSGKQTRAQIQHKSEEIVDKTNEFVKDSYKQVQRKASDLSESFQEKVGQLKEYGQDKLVEGIDNVTDALDEGKDKIESM